jgi:hypothetical protein
MKNEWNWMREPVKKESSVKTLTEPCGCNKPYQLQATNYVLCLDCGSQYPDPDRTHLFGGMTVHGEAVCSQDCWCQSKLSELEKKLSKDKANLSGLGEEE